jgi:hypothetical protein
VATRQGRDGVKGEGEDGSLSRAFERGGGVKSEDGDGSWGVLPTKFSDGPSAE